MIHFPPSVLCRCNLNFPPSLQDCQRGRKHDQLFQPVVVIVNVDGHTFFINSLQYNLQLKVMVITFLGHQWAAYS